MDYMVGLNWSKARKTRAWNENVIGYQEAERIKTVINSPFIVLGSWNAWDKGILAFYEAFTHGNPKMTRTLDEIGNLLAALGISSEGSLEQSAREVTDGAAWIFSMNPLAAMMYLRKSYARGVDAVYGSVPFVKTLMFTLCPTNYPNPEAYTAEISPYVSGD